MSELIQQNLTGMASAQFSSNNLNLFSRILFQVGQSLNLLNLSISLGLNGNKKGGKANEVDKTILKVVNKLPGFKMAPAIHLKSVQVATIL